jgi:hypothetical protein
MSATLDVHPFFVLFFVRASHFGAMLLFALFVSLVLAGLVRGSLAQRAKYATRAFLLFLLFGIGIAWLMYPFSH